MIRPTTARLDLKPIGVCDAKICTRNGQYRYDVHDPDRFICGHEHMGQRGQILSFEIS
jgi:hypothetical protein